MRTGGWKTVRGRSADTYLQYDRNRGRTALVGATVHRKFRSSPGADLRRAVGFLPELYRTYAALERRIGLTLLPTRRPLPKLTGVPFITDAGPDELTGPINA